MINVKKKEIKYIKLKYCVYLLTFLTIKVIFPFLLVIKLFFPVVCSVKKLIRLYLSSITEKFLIFYNIYFILLQMRLF